MTSNPFWRGETHVIVKAMKARGNRPGLVADWKEKVAAWARSRPTDPDAQAVNAWLPHWQIRPFYTAEELAPLWPALAIAIGHTNRWPSVVKSPARLEYELHYAGLPSFQWMGRKYFIVERLHYWKEQIAKENLQEIENAMA